jgi:hypothetical protein
MTAFLIGQENFPTKAELELLNNNKNAEMIRIYRKWISHLFAQHAAMLIKAKPEDLEVKQGILQGFTLCWNLPYQAVSFLEEDPKKKKESEPLAEV